MAAVREQRGVEGAAALAAALKAEARRAGFELVGIAPAVAAGGFHSFLEWLERGFDGEMAYLRRRREAYEHPRGVLGAVRSVVMLGMNYRTAEPRAAGAAGAARAAGAMGAAGANAGRVSRYAWGAGDYHDVLRERLGRLAAFLHAERPGCRTRGVVDTAPLLERDFARLAGLGWFGKNTMLLNTRAGSWLFLAGLLTDLELEYDEPHAASHCGTCTRCLEACPTAAFPEPYVLDARRCISYLTIELRGPIPVELREGVGEWLFGCDVCQEVCPWNRKAPVSDEPAFVPLDGMDVVDLIELVGSLVAREADGCGTAHDGGREACRAEEDFARRFGQTAVARPGRAGLLRNACVVLGNVGDVRAVPALIAALGDREPVVRGAAAWALGRLGRLAGNEATAALQSRLVFEDNPEVRREVVEAMASVNDERMTKPE